MATKPREAVDQPALALRGLDDVSPTGSGRDAGRQLPAAVTVEHTDTPPRCAALAAARRVCPTGARSRRARRQRAGSSARCILCGRCVAAAPDLFAWRARCRHGRLAAVPAVVAPAIDEDRRRRGRCGPSSPRRVRRLRRSVHIRHVDAGSDGSDEWEVQALTQPRLRRAPARHLLHRQPPPCRHPAGHRHRHRRDGRRRCAAPGRPCPTRWSSSPPAPTRSAAACSAAATPAAVGIGDLLARRRVDPRLARLAVQPAARHPARPGPPTVTGPIPEPHDDRRRAGVGDSRRGHQLVCRTDR